MSSLINGNKLEINTNRHLIQLPPNTPLQPSPEPLPSSPPLIYSPFNDSLIGEERENSIRNLVWQIFRIEDRTVDQFIHVVEQMFRNREDLIKAASIAAKINPELFFPGIGQKFHSHTGGSPIEWS